MVTIQPRMYRESLALALQRYRPGAEVMLGPLNALDGEVERFRPHLLVRNDTDGADMELLKGALCWIEILYSDGMDARISLDAKVWEIEDISTENLLALVDKVEGLIPKEPAS